MTGKPTAGWDLDRLQQLLRRLPPPPAGAEFRDRVRSRFVHDAFPAAARRRRQAWWFTPWWTTAALASSAAILTIVTALNAGPAWKIVNATGSGTVRINGQPVPLDAPAEVARRLRPRADVAWPGDGQLDLELPGIALVQIVGGSHATLPGSPGRWFGRTMTASLDAGEIRIATGPAFPGTRLVMMTPETRAIVTGTTLAVIRQSDASCVCVLDGTVAMTNHASDATVRAGFRRSVFRDGSTPRVEPIRPMETMKLTMLRAQAERVLSHPAER